MDSPSELFRVFRTVNEMVHDRGYLVSKSELEMSLNDFQEIYCPQGNADRSRIIFLVQHSQNPEEKLLIFFADEETVGIKLVRKYFNTNKNM